MHTTLLPTGGGLKLLGEIEGASIVTRTTDTTPEGVIKVPVGFTFPSGQVSLTDGVTVFGPYAIAVANGLGTFNVGVALPTPNDENTYTISGNPGLFKGVAKPVKGVIIIEIEEPYLDSFDDEYADSVLNVYDQG